MKKIISFFCLLIFISCNSDLEESVILNLTVTSNPIDGGIVSMNSGEFELGSVVKIKATPAEEYIFEKWTGDAAGTSSNLSVKMDDNKSIVANFIKKQYPLKLEIEGEGTIT